MIHTLITGSTTQFFLQICVIIITTALTHNNGDENMINITLTFNLNIAVQEILNILLTFLIFPLRIRTESQGIPIIAY